MTDTIKAYAVDAARVVYPVTVPFIERDHIHVYTGTDPNVQLAYTWVTDASVQLQTPATDVVTVRRVTVPEVLDFKNNAWMQESVLDRAFNITGYQAEEAKDVADLLDPQAVAQEVAELSTDIAVAAAAIAVEDAIAPAVAARDAAIEQVALAEQQVVDAEAEVAKAAAHVVTAQQAKSGAEAALNGIGNELALAKAEVVLCKAETTLCIAETTKCRAETALCVAARNAAQTAATTTQSHVVVTNQDRTDCFNFNEQSDTYASNAADSASAALASKTAAEQAKSDLETGSTAVVGTTATQVRRNSDLDIRYPHEQTAEERRKIGIFAGFAHGTNAASHRIPTGWTVINSVVGLLEVHHNWNHDEYDVFVTPEANSDVYVRVVRSLDNRFTISTRQNDGTTSGGSMTNTSCHFLVLLRENAP